MEKQIYDEKNGLWYEMHGDYYLPCLTVLPEEQRPIGIGGLRRRRYIQQHRKAFYAELLASGKLNGYLADLNEHPGSSYGGSEQRSDLRIRYRAAGNFSAAFL